MRIFKLLKINYVYEFTREVVRNGEKKYARTINDSTRGGARPKVIACFFSE